MRTAAEIVAFAVGVILVAVTLQSAVRSTILPRNVQNRLARWSAIGVRVVFRVRVGRSSTYERRDRIMAMLGPVALVMLLVTWLVVIMAGYTLMFLATTTTSVSRAIELSGSSVFTLGSAAPGELGGDLISYSEAGFGLLVVTLLITYLPSIYSSFSRREVGVSLLRVRAGNPPQATTMLVRYHRIEPEHYRLTELWQTWENWFVEVEESHTTFPLLVFFRSPLPDQSWITAAGTLLDAASIWVSSIDHPPDPDAQLCIRAGFQCLRRIATTFDIPNDPEPRPDEPVSVDRSEWETALDELARAGLDVVSDREVAWKAWQGWRVNYDTALLNLSRMVEAPPAPWVADRSPLRPDQRWSFRHEVTPTVPNARSRRSRGPGRR